MFAGWYWPPDGAPREAPRTSRGATVNGCVKPAPLPGARPVASNWRTIHSRALNAPAVPLRRPSNEGDASVRTSDISSARSTCRAAVVRSARTGGAVPTDWDSTAADPLHAEHDMTTSRPAPRINERAGGLPFIGAV